MAKYDRVCPMCNKNFTANRADKIYCSRACKVRAAYHRKHLTNRLAAHEDVKRDVRTLSKYSLEAAQTVDKVAALCGMDIANEVLDGYWSLLIKFNADLTV